MRTNKPFGHWQNASAFSLIELMTTVAVLAIMGLFLVQTIDIANKTVNRSEGAVDAAAEARLVFDRIALDLAAMFIRKDMDYQFQNLLYSNSSDDVMRFYSEVFTERPASSANAVDSEEIRLSVVGYRMIPALNGRPNAGGKLALCRGSRGVAYFDAPTGDNFMGLLPDATNPDLFDVVSLWTVGSNLNDDSDYDVLSPGVFRIEMAFVDASGQVVTTTPQASLHGGTTSTDISDIRYLIVGIAVLGAEDRAKLTADNINTLASSLPAVGPGETPFQAWETSSSSSQYVSGRSTVAGLPESLVKRVRFFQRAFPISDR